MRKLNRMIAASALAVPMALGTSGIAMADMGADSSGVQNQVETSEGNSSEEGDSGQGELGQDIRDIFGVGDDEGSDEGNSGGDGILNGGGDDEDDSEGDGILEILEELFSGDSDEDNSSGDSNLLG